jgi:hypothetical protein
MHRAIRSLAFALALPVLASGAVHARPLAARPSPTASLGALWQWVASHLPAWTKEGSTMDPDGNRLNLLPPLPTTDSGGMMDPDG